MSVYQIPMLAAALIRAPVWPSVVFDRSLEKHLPHASVYRGLCWEGGSRTRHPLYLADLGGIPSPDRFLLSCDGTTFFRPRTLGVEERTDPRGEPRNGHSFLRLLGGIFLGNEEGRSGRSDRNDAYHLLLLDENRVALVFERGEPHLWRSLHGAADVFDSAIYQPGRLNAENLLAAGFQAMDRMKAHKMLSAPSARFLR